MDRQLTRWAARAGCGVLATLLGAPVAWAAPPDDPAPDVQRWSVTLESFIGSPTAGVTRVRENALTGDRLGLRRDLGIDSVEAIGVTAVVPLGARTALVGSVTRLFLWGAADLPQDRTHNSTTYAANSRLDSRPDFTAMELRWRQRLVNWGAAVRGTLYGELGARVDYLDWHFQGTLAPGSIGHETGEGFYKQATPVPVVGLVLQQSLNAWAWTETTVRLGGARHWYSGRREGGAVYFSETLFDVRASVGYDIGPHWRVALHARFFHLTLRERSREDGNVLRLPVLGAGLSVQYRF